MWPRLLILILCLFLVPGAAAPPPAPALAVVGDSLSAAFGISAAQGWVSLLQRRITDLGYPHRVVNASVTGDTTSGGLSRLPALLERERPEVVVIELGGNDGLRGITPEIMAENLRRMIRLARGSGAGVLLLGVELPGNYGNAFRTMFHGVYYAVAGSESVPLVPSFLEGVAMDPELMQDDGIHPNAAAQPLMLDRVWPLLEPLLAAQTTAGAGR